MADQRVNKICKSKAIPLAGFSADDDDLKCSICWGILNNPMSCNSNQCGNSFCNTCIRNWLNAESTCPLCKNTLTVLSLIPNRSLNNLVKNCQVQCNLCTNEDNGMKCDWTGKLGDLDTHITDTCQFRDVICSNSGCQHSCQEYQLKEHLLICDYKNAECSLCNNKISCKDMDEHLLSKCLYRIVPCPNACYASPFAKTRLPFHRLTLHLARCPYQLVECPLYELGSCSKKCTGKICKQDFQNHISSQPEAVITALKETVKNKKETKNISQRLYQTQKLATVESLLVLIESYNSKDNYEGLLAILVAPLCRTSPELCIRVCEALERCMQDYSTELSSLDICSVLIEVLKSPLAFESSDVATVLCSLAERIVFVNFFKMYNNGGFEAVHAILKSDVTLQCEDAIEAACLAVHELTQDDYTVSGALKFVEDGIVESLVTALKSSITLHSSDAIMAACRAIYNCSFDIGCATKFCDLGICDTLAVALKLDYLISSEPATFERVCRVVSACCRNEYTSEKLSQAGIREILMSLFSTSFRVLIPSICETIKSFCRYSDANKMWFGSYAGFFEHLVSFLNLSNESVYERCALLDLIRDCCEDNTNNATRFGEVGGCEALVNVLKQQNSSNIVKNLLTDLCNTLCICAVDATNKTRFVAVSTYETLDTFSNLPDVLHDSETKIALCNALMGCSKSANELNKASEKFIEVCDNLVPLTLKQFIARKSWYGQETLSLATMKFFKRLLVTFGSDMKIKLKAVGIGKLIYSIKKTHNVNSEINILFFDILHLLE